MLPQDPVCCLRETFSDKIGLHGPICRVPGEFAFTVAGTGENAARTLFSRKFHVAITIPNDKAALQIERVLSGRAIRHARRFLWRRLRGACSEENRACSNDGPSGH